MDYQNPLLSKATVSGDRDRAPLSNLPAAVQPEKPRKRISAKTERLIGELGLRYRPSAQEDLEAHAATLGFLTTDVSDIPPDILEQAIAQHVRTSHFMPKASELIAIAQTFVPRAGKIDWVQRGNDHLRANGRFDIEWHRDASGNLKLGPVGSAAEVAMRAQINKISGERGQQS
jgi:hypothetical protein